MALLVPNIGEIESLRYLIAQNNFVQDLEDTSPRNLVLKLFTSNTTPAEGDVPSTTAYFEPYIDGNTNGYGTTANTGYPNCVDNRTDQNYTQQYGILLNGSRWVIKNVGSGTTATYPEQTFTFTGPAGNIYGYYVTRANNMPVAIHGVVDAASGAAAATINKGSSGSPCIGVIGQDYITLPNTSGIVDNVTLGMQVSAATTAAIAASGVFVGGIDRATRRIYLVDASNVAVLLTDNIQAATDPTINLDYTTVTTTSAHGLQKGDVIYIARGTSNTTTTENTYTIFDVPSGTTFETTPALNGTGNLTLYSSIMFAERFTNGPYPIQNNGDQIKVTLNISLD